MWEKYAAQLIFIMVQVRSTTLLWLGFKCNPPYPTVLQHTHDLTVNCTFDCLIIWPNDTKKCTLKWLYFYPNFGFVLQQFRSLKNP